MKEKKEFQKSKKTLTSKIPTLRNSLQERIHNEFINDLGNPPEEAELKRDSFASQFQEIGHSGVEINHGGRCEEKKISWSIWGKKSQL